MVIVRIAVTMTVTVTVIVILVPRLVTISAILITINCGIVTIGVSRNCTLYRTLSGDPEELMALSVKHAMFTYEFMREASKNQRTWFKELLDSAWRCCNVGDANPTTGQGHG